MATSKVACIAICIFGIMHVLNAQEYHTLDTGVGAMIGVVESVPLDTNPVKVTKFLGIPYAEPPVGNLRFEKPLSKSPWTSTLNATTHGNACAQFDFDQGYDAPFERSEDCLFLNVYVPYNMSASGSQGYKRPVMIWIHGGGFVIGESNLYDGILLSGYGDVIIVTINYRLAYYGFMTTGDDALPGNLGLWDQHMAIRWVHDNIDSFGGDASRVTLFGESAGSASVVYQCFYPGNLGLFHRAIAMSGSLTAAWSFMDKDLASQDVRTLAANAGCSQQTMAGMIECLKTVPSETFRFQINPTVLSAPVLDNDFVLDTPVNLLSGNSAATNAYQMFHSIDLMIGTTNADGLADSGTILLVLNTTGTDDFVLTKTDYEDKLIPRYLTRFVGNSPKDAVNCVAVNEYTDWSNPSSNNKRVKQLTYMLTDLLFTVPSVLTANLHAMDNNNNQQRSTYLYEFAVRPMEHAIPIPSFLDGDDVMNHGDDIVFVFGMDIDKVMADGNYSYLIATYQAAMTMWTNFAKSGNPNLPTDVSTLINSTWPEYTTANKDYILITKNMSPESIKRNQRPQAVNFWNNTLPSLLETTSQDISRDNKTVRVTSPVGEIIGTESYVPFSSDCGFRVQHFLGIPYAKSTEGALRFQKPVAREPFTEPFNATQFGPRCYQVSLPGRGGIPKSEDCLMVNVFVPVSPSQQGGNKAVMVWIHGGGFTAGESNLFDPSVLVGYSDVVVVTLNYRLGHYGFMTTGDSTIPSNIGLWDQHMALQWVHDNIAAFGGDNTRVTIFGESAGGISVAYQAMYPGNKGLFQRVIAQSGATGNPRAYTNIQDSLTVTREFSTLTRCPLESTRDFLKCLQSKTIDELQDAMGSTTSGITTRPTRDNIFILDTPENILSGNSNAREAIEMFNSIDLISGYTSADGIGFSLMWPTLLGQTDFDQFTCTRTQYETVLLTQILRMSSLSNLFDHGRRSIIHEYTDWSDPESFTKRKQQLIDLPTESWFAVPAVRAADLHMASNRSTYVYQFSVQPLVRAIPVPATFNGPTVMAHGDDIDFVMGMGVTRVSDSDEHYQQLRVYQAAMTMWSNFAKSGNPNSPNDVTKYIYTSWPQYTSSRQYLDITPEVTQHAVKERPRLRAVNFWTQILPETARISQTPFTCETSAAERTAYTTPGLFAFLIFANLSYMYLK